MKSLLRRRFRRGSKTTNEEQQHRSALDAISEHSSNKFRSMPPSDTDADTPKVSNVAFESTDSCRSISEDNSNTTDSQKEKSRSRRRMSNISTTAMTDHDDSSGEEKIVSQDDNNDNTIKKESNRSSSRHTRLSLENIQVHESIRMNSSNHGLESKNVTSDNRNEEEKQENEEPSEKAISFLSSSTYSGHRPYRASMFDHEDSKSIACSNRSFTTHSSEDIPSSNEDFDYKFKYDTNESMRQSSRTLMTNHRMSRRKRIYLKSKKYARALKKKSEKASASKSIGSRLLLPWYMMATLSSSSETPETTLVTRATFLLMSSLTCAAGLVWSFMYLVLDERLAAVFPTAYSILMSLCLVWCCFFPALGKSHKDHFGEAINKGKSQTDDVDRFPTVVFVQLFLILVLPICVQLSLGGMVESGGVVLWSFLCPLGAAIFCENSSTSTRWFGIYIVAIVSTILSETTNISKQYDAIILSSIHVGYFIMNFVGAFTIIFIGASSFSSKLEEEYSRSELLLQNMLPKSIATRLKRGENNFADNYESCSILFADLVGFTKSASELHPNFLIGLFLKDVFMAFDQATEMNGLEKIKTIGDAYMVVGGLDIKNTKNNAYDHSDIPRNFADIKKGQAVDVINLAFDLQEALGEVNEKYGLDFQLRIGIHTGPVIAGVIGNAKFAFGKLYFI